MPRLNDYLSDKPIPSLEDFSPLLIRVTIIPTGPSDPPNLDQHKYNYADYKYSVAIKEIIITPLFVVHL
jgi:hypothetical protein